MTVVITGTTQRFSLGRAGARRLALAAFALPLAIAAAGCGGTEGDADPAADDTEDSAPVVYPTTTLHLMAPAAPGGGWDTTARTIQQTLRDADLVNGHSVEVYNVEGAAGTLGLAELVTQHEGDAHRLMISGLVMVGGVVTNDSAVNLTQTTPIATLTAEAEVIIVPAESEYETLEQLVNDFKADPASVTWGGGSAGGTDHVLVGLLAKAADVDPAAVTDKYVAYSGGGEVKAGLLSGDLTAAVSGVSEFRDLVEAGEARALAVSSSAPLDAGADEPTPTIIDAGYDVELMNWRGVVAPPGIGDAERASIVTLIDEMRSSPEWQEVLEQQGWEDFYVNGDEAATFFQDESSRITEVLTDIGLAE
jgi:putative tricarboxylic transport membrane protein